MIYISLQRSSLICLKVAVYTLFGKCAVSIDNYTSEKIALDKSVYIIQAGEKAIKVRI